MRWTLAAAVASALWVLPAWCYTTTPMGPGGGGAFNCSATTGLPSGRVLVGSDNSGMYGRNGSSGNWTRIGSGNGLTSTNIYTIAFAHTPTYVLAGTGDGLFRSTDTGQSWSVPALYDTVGALMIWDDVTAVAWGTGSGDSAATAYVCFYKPSHDRPVVAISEDHGATFRISGLSGMPANGSSDDFVPVKIAQDPSTTGSSRDLYVLFGLDNTSDPAKTRRRELWRSQTNGTYFSKVSDGSGPAYPIDFAIYPDGSQLVVSASDQSGDPEDVVTGTTWVYKTSGTWVQTWPWSYNSSNPPGSPDLSKLTGAVWTDGTKEYLLKVDKNTGSAGTPAPPRCVLADISRYAGVWWRGTQDSSVWRRSDSGSTWELGWTSCQLARGTINSGVAKSLSKMGLVGAGGDGPYFNTMQFLWRYDASQSKFFGEFTNGDWGGTQFNTLRLDNANAATVEAPDDSAVWAGYYDIGLWKYNGAGWENHNQDLAEWGNKYGGNVNGIHVAGNLLVVTGAASSKGNNWRVFKSTDTGSTFSVAGSGLPVVGATYDKVFLHSLTSDPPTGRLWLVAASHSSSGWVEAVYYSTDNGSNWNSGPTGLPSTGIMVIRGYNGMLLAGGWQGLYRYNGSGWSQVATINAPNPAGSAENTTTHLHRHLWYGVHDIYMDSNAYWYITCYAPSTEDTWTSGSKGVYRSTDGGATFTQIRDGRMYQAVAVDSCGARLYFTSGKGFSSPVNGSNQFQGHGLEIARWDGGNLRVEDAFTAGDGVWGFPQAHGIRAPDDFGVYVIAPGYGIHRATNGGACSSGGGGCEGGCETDRPGASSAARPRQEGFVKPPQTLFTVAVAREEIAAGRLALYDLTGRTAKLPKPGIYFVLERNTAGVVTSRRTVVLIP